MGAGFYKFRESDVEGLTLMLSHMQGQTFDKRCRMVLVCLANTWEDESKSPCPFFSLGQRTLAEKVGESPRSCQKFFESMERDGWIVRLGQLTNRGGRFTMRTFAWMAERDGVQPQTQQKGLHRVQPPRVAPLAENPAKEVAPVQPSARKKGCTSDSSYELSDKGGTASADAARLDETRGTLAEIFRRRDEGWEPEWMK